MRLSVLAATAILPCATSISISILTTSAAGAVRQAGIHTTAATAIATTTAAAHARAVVTLTVRDAIMTASVRYALPQTSKLPFLVLLSLLGIAAAFGNELDMVSWQATNYLLGGILALTAGWSNNFSP